MIEDLIVYGAISGAVYALLALGFTLIYGVADVINLSHGALYMLGAYMFSAFLSSFQLDLLPASILAVIFVGFVGIIAYRLFIHPIIDDVLAVLVVTLGVALIIQQLVLLEFGGGHIVMPSLVEGPISFLGVTVMSQQLLALVVSLSLIFILWIFITKSKIGGAMRAAAQDREVAMLMGINTERLYMLTMFISASLAATASILIAPTEAAHPYMWTYPLVMSFAIVVLGGLGNIKGSLVGAFIVGYAEKSVIFLIPEGSFLKGAVALTVMVLVLLFRPKGLFGKRTEAA